MQWRSHCLLALITTIELKTQQLPCWFVVNASMPTEAVVPDLGHSQRFEVLSHNLHGHFTLPLQDSETNAWTDTVIGQGGWSDLTPVPQYDMKQPPRIPF